MRSAVLIDLVRDLENNLVCTMAKQPDAVSSILLPAIKKQIYEVFLPPNSITIPKSSGMYSFIGATQQKEVVDCVKALVCDDTSLKRYSHFNAAEVGNKKTCRESLLRLLFSWDGSDLGTGFKQIFQTYYGKAGFKVLEGQPRLLKDKISVGQCNYVRTWDGIEYDPCPEKDLLRSAPCFKTDTYMAAIDCLVAYYCEKNVKEEQKKRVGDWLGSCNRPPPEEIQESQPTSGVFSQPVATRQRSKRKRVRDQLTINTDTPGSRQMFKSLLPLARSIQKAFKAKYEGKKRKNFNGRTAQVKAFVLAPKEDEKKSHPISLG